MLFAGHRTPDTSNRLTQVDPFGHSATHASLLTYEAGFDAMYFGRIDGDDIARRQASLETEMVWRPSESAGPGNQIFAGAMYWSVSRAGSSARGLRSEGSDWS